MLISSQRSLLIIIDMQEKLVPHLIDPQDIIDNNRRLLKLASALNIPAIATEQYSHGLGHTLPELLALLPQPYTPVEKSHFSAVREGGLHRHLTRENRQQIIVCGSESHICVLQTALDLIAMNKEVFVVADACGSRSTDNKQLAMQRLQSEGVQLVNTEMVMFEWLQRADTETFRQALQWIKSLPPALDAGN